MKQIITVVCIFMIAGTAKGQTNTNYDESKVTPYVLPEALKTTAGRTIRNAKDWESLRRPEILEIFSREVYGRTPRQKPAVRYELISEDNMAMGGKAIRKEIKACFSDAEDHCVAILLYLPKSGLPAPVFLGLNFEGNHSVYADTGIQLNPRWMRRTDIRGVVNHHATEASRGQLYSRWQVEKLIERGYGLATVYQGDFELDRPGRSGKDGIRHLFGTGNANDEWGSIGVWAWGLSRVMDYLETDTMVDAKKVALVGHSRLGKAAIWAGAQDQRFAMVISNNSGEGGASLSRRNYGETIADLNRVVSYWFCPNYKKYNENAAALPVDAHLLLALMAPRPIYVASATLDTWADPKGEYLAAYGAGAVYALYNKKGLADIVMPPPDTPVGEGSIGYHLRTGEHDITAYDWEGYLNFADKHLK